MDIFVPLRDYPGRCLAEVQAFSEGGGLWRILSPPGLQSKALRVAGPGGNQGTKAV